MTEVTTMNSSSSLTLFAGILHVLENESRKNVKISIIKDFLTVGAHPKVDEMRKLFYYALDPLVTFGVATFPIPDRPAILKRQHEDHLFPLLIDMLERLRTRQLTGRSAHVSIQSFLELISPTELFGAGSISVREAVARILRKDLRCGVQVGGSTIHKACPGLINSFGCQLADSEIPSLDAVTFPIAVEPKYDGVRCIAIIDDNGHVELLSRNGKKFENFAEFEQSLSSSGLRSIVFDGEIVGKDHANQYKHVMKRANASPGTHTDLALVYCLFDTMSFDQFRLSKGTSPLGQRRLNLEELFNHLDDSLFRLTSSKVVHSAAELSQNYHDLINNGYEGVIIKRLDAIYAFKRNRDWQKIKPMDSADLTITAILEGEGKNVGKMGAIELQGIHSGKVIKTKCGSGFNDEMRLDAWINPEKWLGRIAEIKFQDITRAEDGDHDSLRFPIFQRFRIADHGGKV